MLVPRGEAGNCESGEGPTDRDVDLDPPDSPIPVVADHDTPDDPGTGPHAGWRHLHERGRRQRNPDPGSRDPRG